MTDTPADIDAYLAGVPDDARATLTALRRTINRVAPEATESISYGLPTFKYRGRSLIYFGAAKNHCALYGTAQGTIRFPPGEPPSDELIETLLSARMANIEAAMAKKKRKPGAAGQGG